MNNFKLTAIVLLATLVIGTASKAQNNNQAVISKFLILVETTDQGIKLTSKEGCAWIELTFTSKMNQSQAIDQYGMTTLDNNNDKVDANLADFLFTIQETEKGLSFEGFEGTAWTKLAFTCKDNKCHQAIDQNGMTTIN